MVVRQLIESAEGKCAYCGRAVNFQRTLQNRHDGPSLDRIVPQLGYVERNIVLACYRCNAIKNDASAEELERLAFAVRQLVIERKLSCPV